MVVASDILGVGHECCGTGCGILVSQSEFLSDGGEVLDLRPALRMVTSLIEEGMIFLPMVARVSTVLINRCFLDC